MCIQARILRMLEIKIIRVGGGGGSRIGVTVSTGFEIYVGVIHGLNCS